MKILHKSVYNEVSCRMSSSVKRFTNLSGSEGFPAIMIAHLHKTCSSSFYIIPHHFCQRQERRRSDVSFLASLGDNLEIAEGLTCCCLVASINPSD